MSDEQSLAGEPDTTAFLRDLLERAAAAHGVHEAEALGGVYDVNWPQWYAEHMARSLTEAGYRLSKVDP